MREAGDIRNVAVIGGGYVGRGVGVAVRPGGLSRLDVQPKPGERGSRAR